MSRGTTRLDELGEQEVALRRLAELATRVAERQEIFDAVVFEASRLTGEALVTLVRMDLGGEATVVAPRTGPSEGERGITASIEAPIHVDGRLWGAVVVSAPGPALTEVLGARLRAFAEGLGPAIGGALARADLLDLLDEHAAVRRVAERVARGCEQQELFQTVADEASRLVGGEGTTLLRVLTPGTRALVLATCGAVPVPVGEALSLPPGEAGVIATIVRDRAPARVDNYRAVEGVSYGRDGLGLASGVGVPIVLEDRVWGVLAASRWDGPLPDGVERRLAQFAELVAAALASSAARAEVQALADEQSALRRVAELVARAAPQEDVFSAVAQEASRLVGEPMMLVRIDDGDTLVVVASAGGPSDPGWSIPMTPDTLAAQVVRTGRAARKDQYAGSEGPRFAQRAGPPLSAVAAPIIIAGRIWGVLAASSPDHVLPAATEERLAQFADLIAVAIANAESRAALAASRARVLATADEARHRLQRDVHDGAQQRLVQTIMTLKLARRELAENPGGDLVTEALAQAQKAADDLRDLVRGIMPAALTRGGLRTGIEALVADLPLQVDVRVQGGRLAPALETTAYFVVAEALANVVKHAGVPRAAVTVAADEEVLVVEVRDEGAGTVDRRAGSGITGLFDRVEAAGGTLAVTGRPGAGTTVRAVLPLVPSAETP